MSQSLHVQQHVFFLSMLGLRGGHDGQAPPSHEVERDQAAALSECVRVDKCCSPVRVVRASEKVIRRTREKCRRARSGERLSRPPPCRRHVVPRTVHYAWLRKRSKRVWMTSGEYGWEFYLFLSRFPRSKLLRVLQLCSGFHWLEATRVCCDEAAVVCRE